MISKEFSALEPIFQDEALARSIFGDAFFFADFELDLGITSQVLVALGLSEKELRNGTYMNRIHPEDLKTYNTLWARVDQSWENDFYCKEISKVFEISSHNYGEFSNLFKQNKLENAFVCKALQK